MKHSTSMWLWLCLACVVRLAAAQTTREMIRREMTLERETRQELAPSKTFAKKALFDYGAYVRTNVGSYSSSRAGRRMTRTYRSMDIRVWSSLTLAEIHHVYFRLRTDLTDFNDDQEYPDSRFRRGPNVDQFFYMVDLDELAARTWGQQWPFKLRMTLGRQYQYLGSGMVYSMVNDGAQFETTAGDWDIKLLGSRTVGREKNIDRSTGVDDNERFFGGVEIGFNGITNHRQYFFVLVQRDETDASVPAVTADIRPAEQEFNYQSQYYGIGFTGPISRHLSYHMEGVMERGTSYGDVTKGTWADYHHDHDNIDAYAFNLGVDYTSSHPSRARFSLDYFLATGDSHRDSPLDTIGGNRPGTGDHGFINFGYVDTGFALAPEFSNIQFIRLDGSFRPLYKFKDWDRVEWGATYFFLQKQQSHGGISDPLASDNQRGLGHELDTYLFWRIFSDVSFSMRYGILFPGHAFAQRRVRQFLLGSLTYSF